MDSSAGTWALSSSEFAVHYAEHGAACALCGGTGGIMPLRAVVVVMRGGREVQRACLGCLIRVRDEHVAKKPMPVSNNKKDAKLAKELEVAKKARADSEALSTELACTVKQWRERASNALQTRVVELMTVDGRQIRFGVPEASAKAVQSVLSQYALVKRGHTDDTGLEARTREGLRCAKLIYEAMGGEGFDETSARQWGNVDLITVPMHAGAVEALRLGQDVGHAMVNGVPLVLPTLEEVEANAREQVARAGGDTLNQLFLDPDNADKVLHKVLYSS